MPAPSSSSPSASHGVPSKAPAGPDRIRADESPEHSGGVAPSHVFDRGSRHRPPRAGMLEGVDERARALDARVAAAADAWLADPRDAGVYARLVTAILARRAYLNPPLPSPPMEVEAMHIVPVVEQDDELLDELAEGERAVQTIATVLDGEPVEVLTRLRRPPDR